MIYHYIIWVSWDWLKRSVGELGFHRSWIRGLYVIRSQSRSVVKCNDVENWIELFTGCPSEEPFKGSLQHQGLLQLSSQKGINIPSGLSGYCQYPRGDFKRAHLKRGYNWLWREVPILLTERQNKLRSSGAVEEDEECYWMNIAACCIICQTEHGGHCIMICL